MRKELGAKSKLQIQIYKEKLYKLISTLNLGKEGGVSFTLRILVHGSKFGR